MDTAPTTALSGRHKSEDSLAISTAILATLYTVCHSVSPPSTVAPSLDASRILENAEPMERAIAVDEATSALGSLRDMNFGTRSAGDGGVVAGDFDLRKPGIVMRAGGKISSIIGLDKRKIDNVVRAPRIGFEIFTSRSGLTRRRWKSVVSSWGNSS